MSGENQLPVTGGVVTGGVVDVGPINATLTDHEKRIKALEAGSHPPSPGATLVVGTWYSEMSRFAEMRAKGFGHVHEWAYTDRGSMGYLDAAHAHGLKVFLELSWCMETPDGVGKFDQGRLNAQMLPEYIAHPALAGWVGWDEPDLRHTPEAEMQKLYDAIAVKDAVHPTICTIRYPWKSTGLPYVKFPKIVAVDPYMVPYGPPAQAGQETASSVTVVSPKPTWTDVQTFNWKNTFSPPGRMPTPQEVEVMGTTSIQAQTHPNKGVYCYLEDELMADSALRNAIAGIVAKWRALVPTAAVMAAPPEVTPEQARAWKPLPKHAEMDAMKAAMKDKRRHYPKP